MLLKLMLVVSGRTLLLRVLEQEGIERGILCQDENVAIVSNGSPQIEGSALYIRGETKSGDDDFSVYRYRGTKSAEEAKVKFTQCLAKYFGAGTINTDASIFTFRRP